MRHTTKMILLKTLVSEHRAANLLGQIRWRDGVYCPRCRAESVIRDGSYRVLQRYLCKDCDRMSTTRPALRVLVDSAQEEWSLAFYTYIRLNASIRQLDADLAVVYKTVYQRVQRFLRALDGPRLHLEGPVEIDELYVSTGEERLRERRPVALA